MTRLPSFSMDSISPSAKSKNLLMPKLLDLICSRPELAVQRAGLYMFLSLCEQIKDGNAVLRLFSDYATEHPNRLHPLATIVDIMVSHRDGLFIGIGFKMVNLLIRAAEAAGPNEAAALAAELDQTLFLRVAMQFSMSPSAQEMEEVAQELKKYQGWVLRDAKRRLADKFLLADPEHRKLLVGYWNLRHPNIPCPVREDSSGYNDETKELWMDLGFFNDPLTYITCVMRMHDLFHFASTRTANWLALLDKLSGIRKMQERAKGAAMGKG